MSDILTTVNDLDVGFAGTAPPTATSPNRFDDSYVKESFVGKVEGGTSSRLAGTICAFVQIFD